MSRFQGAGSLNRTRNWVATGGSSYAPSLGGSSHNDQDLNMALPGAVPHDGRTAAGSDSEAGHELPKARAYFKDLDSVIDPRADEDVAAHTLDDLKVGGRLGRFSVHRPPEGHNGSLLCM